MKILVIDNYSKSTRRLIEYIDSLGYDVDSAVFEEIGMVPLEDYDAYVLSGGYIYNVKENMMLFDKELSIIKEAEKPILGICLGFQLICTAFGDSLKQMVKRRKGFIKSKKTKEHFLLSGLPDEFLSCQSHHYAIEKTDLEVIAVSEDGIEAVHHRSLPLFAVQFHPELDEVNGSSKVINNFLEFVSGLNRQ